jgi:anti-sigma factor RsiW
MTHDPQNCKEIFSLLSQYLDLELPQEVCQEIDEHLAGCSPCVEFVESLRKTVALCRGYQPGIMPAPLTSEARTELENAWRRMQERRTSPSTSRDPKGADGQMTSEP